MSNNYPDNFVLEESDAEIRATEDEVPVLGNRTSKRGQTDIEGNDSKSAKS